MRSAFGCAALGVLLLLVAGTFDAEPLYVHGRGARAARRRRGAPGSASAAWGATVEPHGRASAAWSRRSRSRCRSRRPRAAPAPAGLDRRAAAARARAARAGRQRARVRVEVTFGRRGRRVLAPPALVLRDPFGLAQRVVTGDERRRGARAPARARRCASPPAGGEVATAHARAALIAAAETEIDGLREHREGSPASRIHWPSVARGAGMMERKLISEADSRPLVVLDPRAPASQDALDAAVRAAASLTVHFARRTGCGLLLPGDRRATTVEPDLLGLAPGPRPARADGRADGPGAGRRAEPPRAGRVRRGARRRPPAARARPHARRLPARAARRAPGPPRRCSRWPAATASCAGRTGNAAVLAAVAGAA